MMSMTPIRLPFFCLWAACVLVATAAWAQTPSPGWQLIAVPGSWEQLPPDAREHKGFAWYRTWLKPHDSFFQKHERNLFQESVNINIRDLAGAHELFVNGARIGSGGRMPPNFQSGYKGLHRHKVPPGLLRKGEWNAIAIRVYHRDGPGGFLGEAPFIMNYFMEAVLEGPWEFRLGDDDLSWAGGALAEKPAGSTFAQFRESNRALGEAAEFVTGPKMSPQESLRQMKTADDLQIELLLHEPEIAQPTHLSFDERGRLWVSQYRQYPYPAGLKMVSRDKYYRSHYDRVPPAPPNHDRGRDIISIHEDSDGDGQFDRHKVFQDGLNMANAALRGRGGVWVMHTPYLLFYPDKDFDDVPDGPPVVHLEGFGLEDTHSVANGLVWGMDGWLYGAQGSTTSSRVRRPGLDGPDATGVYFEGCMVWRYHSGTRAYEIFAEGGGNTFGLEVDAQGRLYSGHNGGDTRGWHYVQGGYYLMQGVDAGKFGPPRNPYAFGDLPMMKTETTVVRFSHFGAFAEGTAIPERYAGMLFALDPLHNVMIAVERQARGATFATSDVGPVVSSEDVAFRPVFIANAPDGSLLIADFYEFYIAHGQNYQSQIDPTSGRLYRLRGRNSALEGDIDLARKTPDDLVGLLSHPNKWHRHMAVRLLGERKDASAIPGLKQLLATDTGLGALNALWALHQSDGLDAQAVLRALDHPYAPVRLWAVRLAGDKWGRHPGLGLSGPKAAHGLPDLLAKAMREQATRESDSEVRSQLAASARRLPAEQSLALLSRLLEHDADADDPYIPLLCWWVLETHVASHREEVLAWLKGPALWDRPMVFEHILSRLMRRLALEGQQGDLIACGQLLRMAPSSRHAAQLMKGFDEAYRGRPMIGLPETLIAAMDAAGPAPLIVRLRRGEANASAEALSILRNPQSKVEDRLLYARAFGELREPKAMPMLLSVAAGANPFELRRAALAALSAYNDPTIGAEVASMKLPAELHSPAFAFLASRAPWSLALLQAIEAGQIKASAVPADAIERMRLHQEKTVGALMAKWFPAKATVESTEFQKRISEVEAILRAGTGNPYSGEAIYTERCAACHKLFFKGGNIGPDLTRYQRDDLATMLLSIINPNAEIREGYEYHIVETADGRTLSGFLAERDTQVTVLRGLEGEDMILRQSDIRDIRPLGRSLMGEGLLDGFNEKQLRDLFAFLRISQPITR